MHQCLQPWPLLLTKPRYGFWYSLSAGMCLGALHTLLMRRKQSRIISANCPSLTQLGSLPSLLWACACALRCSKHAQIEPNSLPHNAAPTGGNDGAGAVYLVLFSVSFEIQSPSMILVLGVMVVLAIEAVAPTTRQIWHDWGQPESCSCTSVGGMGWDWVCGLSLIFSLNRYLNYF